MAAEARRGLGVSTGLDETHKQPAAQPWPLHYAIGGVSGEPEDQVSSARLGHLVFTKFSDRLRRVILTERSEVDSESRGQPAVSIVRPRRPRRPHGAPPFVAVVCAQAIDWP